MVPHETTLTYEKLTNPTTQENNPADRGLLCGQQEATYIPEVFGCMSEAKKMVDEIIVFAIKVIVVESLSILPPPLPYLELCL